jgi:nucleotide-binding universal stress UspA family protein
MTAKKILVGYDGTPDARRAARWALDEAARSGAEVEFFYVYEWPSYLPPAAMTPARAVWPGSDVDRAIEDSVADIARSAAVSHPAVPVGTLVERAPAAAALIERSEDAGLVVLGSRGHSAVAGLLGSVTVAVTAGAHCPVVVVRGKPAPREPIVVGVDHSEGALHALSFAFEQAAAHDVPLQVIRAWMPPAFDHYGSAGSMDVVMADERQDLSDLVDRWREKFPAVHAMGKVLFAHPAYALTEASMDAQLVVVGTRGRGAFRGTLLGSVSQHLLHHAESSVAVIRESGGPALS